MKYSLNLPNAARRHFSAAELLVTTDRKDVAGYLYGIAAECAVKAMMLQAGIKELSAAKRRDDPFYMHYPQLKSALLDNLKGRASTPLLQIVGNKAFLDDWSTDMRYAPAKEVKANRVARWRQHATQAVGLIGT